MLVKALIVVDEGIERMLYSVALSRVGLVVFSASTTREAVERCAAEGPFDLLITDVLIDSHGTGRSVAAHLRAFYPATRVLFLASCRLNEVLQRDLLDATVFARGRAAFLRTPLPVSVLIGKALGLLDSAELSLSGAASEDYRPAALAVAAADGGDLRRLPILQERDRGRALRGSAGAA